MLKTDISPVLCRAARGLLGWSQEELARRAEVVPATIRGYELGQKIPRRTSLSSIRRTLEGAGVTFASDPVHGIGAFIVSPQEPTSTAMRPPGEKQPRDHGGARGPGASHET